MEFARALEVMRVGFPIPVIGAAARSGLLAPVGLSATIAAMGPSANHTTRTLIREELFNHTAYEIQIAVMFVPAATSFLRLSFPPVVTSTLCA